MEKNYKLQSLLKRKDIPDDAKTIIKHSLAEQEEERREAHRYRTLYDEVPIGLYRTTPDGKILASNPYLTEILRYDSFEDIQKIDLEKKGFLPTYPRSEFKRKLEESGIITGLESIWKRKDNSLIYVRENAKAIRDESGNIIYYEGSVEDITEQKKAEEKLYRSEKRFRELVETSPDGITLTDLTGQILMINNQGIKIMGYHEQELISMNCFDLLVPEDRDRALENMLKTLKLGKIEGLECKIIRKDGSHIPVEMNTTVIYDDDGNPHNFMATIRDITERRQTEEALRSSEARWRALVDHAPDIILTVDRKGKILFINNPPAGLSREKALGTSVYDYVEPQYREVVQHSIKGVFQTGLPTDYEIAARGPHGRVSWYATRLGPLIRNGEVQAVTLITRDITDQKNAADALRAERDQAQLYLDVVGTIIVAIDKNQEVSLINKKGCEILGYNEEQILGKNWFDNFLPHRLRNGVKDVFNQLIVGEIQPVKFFENPILTKKGEERTIAWYNVVLRNDKGDIIGTLSSGEDITEKKQLEDVRNELEKRRENFIWMTSHELRTPITVILGYTEFLQKYFEELDRNRIERILKVMRNNVDRLERLTTDVAMISKIEQGFLEIDKKELELDDFLKEAVETYKHLLGKQFIFNPPTESSVTLEIDKDRIQQVIDNILNNAIKNTSPKNRQISMDVKVFPNEIQITITDNGAGIHPENLERIFEQFLSIETEYSAIGTGIGLFISRQIISAHDGIITAHSDGIGHGAKFTILLPIKIP
ncbi:MAG: PAS domain S-box protein [Candidatus Hodarchaeota archaeon]